MSSCFQADSAGISAGFDIEITTEAWVESSGVMVFAKMSAPS
jgi:hypothetical protein